MSDSSHRQATPPPLDALDRRILRVLQDDAGITNQALAARVHASPPTCLRRVRRLEQLGIIQGRVAVLDPDALGASLTAILEVTLDRQSAEHTTAFAEHVAQEPAVQQCYQVSGGPDFVLVLCTQDMAHYHALVQRLFTAAHNVRNLRAFFSVARHKFSARVPLGDDG